MQTRLFFRHFPRRLFSLSSLFVLIFIQLCLSVPASAQENETKVVYAYIALEPDIVTNYAGDNSKRLGYLRIAVEILLDDPDLIPDVEYHAPRLRAKVIEIVGSSSEEQVKSLTGREEMRRAILRNFRDILIKETGKEIVKDIIFTKYLRQGG